MGIEAADELGRKSVSARYLEEHPDLVRHLNKYARYMENLIQRCNLTIFEISETDLLGSQRIRDRYGLLTNDSINLHIALANGIGAIATHDDDFDTVGEIRVFKPSDL
jgi:predicted nucleic acid-binding protein